MSDATNNARINVYINGQSGIAEIDKLEKKAQRLGRTIAQVGTNTELGRKLTGELQQTTREIDKLTQKLDLNKMSMKQLEAEARRLKTAWRMAEPNTAEFDRLRTQLDAVQKRMAVVKTGLGPFGQAWKSVWDQLKGLNMALVGMFAGGMIVNFFRGMIRNAAELSDQMADIRKTTGMSAEEVRNLNQEFKKIDTRTLAKDLRDIAIVGGQLGIAKGQINDFVESIDKANVALGDEFQGGASQVADELGKLRNIFTDLKSEKIDQDILHIGNALNELGANGAATGPVIAENANRIGGYGIQAGLTSAQVLGLSASMQELNISSERGSTAIVKILQKMLTNVSAFARVANKPIEEFRELIGKDLYGAFMAVMEGSKNAGESNVEFAKIIEELEVQGAGASEVMAKFGANVGLVNNKVDLAGNSISNTSSLLNEFNLKNQNAAAIVDKLGKKISGWFMNSALTRGIEMVIMKLGEFFKLVDKEGKKAAESVAEFDSAMESFADLTITIEPLIARYDELTQKTTLSADEQAEMKSIIEQVSAVVPEAITQFDQYGNAIGISTGRVREFINAEKARLKVVNAKAIWDFKDQLKIVDKQLDQLQKKRDEFARRGTFTITEYVNVKVGADYKTMKQERDATHQDIVKLQADYTALREKEIGIQAELDRLSGDSMEKQIENFRQKVESQKNATKDAVSELQNQEGFNINTANLDELKSKLKELKGLRNTADPATESFKKFELQIAAVQKRIKELTTSDRAPKKEKEQKEYSADMGYNLQQKYAQEMQKLYSSTRELYRTDKEIAIAEATEKYDELINLNQELQFKKIHAMRFGTEEQKRIAAKELEVLMLQEQQLFDERASAAAQADSKYEADRFKAKKDAEKLINTALLTDQQREILAVTEHFEELLLLAQKHGIDITALVAAREKAIADINAAAVEKDKQKQRERFDVAIQSFQNYAAAASDVLNPLFSILNSKSEKSIQEIQATTDKKLENLEREKERGLITEEQYQRRKLILEKKAQEETNRLKRKQAINDRIAASFQVAISTAEAVMKAWKLSPATFGLPWSAAALVAGGLQSAAIWAAPMPKYRKGAKIKGGIPEGPSHEQGGIDLVNSQTGKKVGEMEGGEPYMILSRDTYKNNGRLIDRLLHVSMNEGGRRMTPQETLDSFVPMQMPEAFKSGGMVSSGGAWSDGYSHRIGTEAIPRPTNDADAKLNEAILKLVEEIQGLREERKQPLKAYTVWRERIEADEEISRVRSFADIG